MKDDSNFLSFELLLEEKIKRVKKNLDNHLSIVTQTKNGASIQEDEYKNILFCYFLQLILCRYTDFYFVIKEARTQILMNNDNLFEFSENVIDGGSIGFYIYNLQYVIYSFLIRIFLLR